MNIKKEKKQISVSAIAIFLMLMSTNMVSAALGDNIPDSTPADILQPMAWNDNISEDVSQPITLSGNDNLAQSFLWKGNGGYIAKGIGLWLQGGAFARGNIKISGIPNGAAIKRAFLYWTTWQEISPPSTSITVNGIPIIENLIGIKTESDPSWPPSRGPHTYRGYRADISNIVTGNGIYRVSGFPTGRIYDRQNTMGASMVVIYSLPTAPMITIVINDGMVVLHTRPQSYTTTLSGFLVPSLPAAKMTLIAGQGEPYWNLDWEYFNGRQLAKNGLDGSDGLVWDTDTYDVSSMVSAGDRSATVKVAMKNDWIGWVATIFSTSPSAITIVSPNGGENWARGSTKLITWTKIGNPGASIRIQLYKGGMLVRTISSNTPNDGSFSWPIPLTQATGSDYKVKITSTSNPIYTDSSDNNFRIS